VLLLDVVPDRTLERKSCLAMIRQLLLDGGKLGKTPGNQQATPTAYNTSAWSLQPCTCRYEYGGFGGKHPVGQYGLARCLDFGGKARRLNTGRKCS
jgi:hypothetical protein